MASYKPKYVTVSQPNTPAAYQNTEAAPAAYKNTETAPAAYQIGTYNSRYGDQLSSALNTVTNWNYNPMQDASYQALAKVYGKRGNEAAKNTLGDAAALNGGYGTSYAVSAAQQARNQYNQELAALIPDLEQNAFNRAQVTYNALRDADDTDYNRFRDTEGDRQWKYSQDYNAYRDRVGDNQWAYSQNYNAYRDRVADNQWAYNANYDRYKDALSQYQWALDYNNALYAQNQASKGSGGGGRRRRSGGGGYSSGSTASSGLDLEAAFRKAADKTKKKTKKATSKYGGINSTTTKNKNKIRPRRAGAQS